MDPRFLCASETVGQKAKGEPVKTLSVGVLPGTAGGFTQRSVLREWLFPLGVGVMRLWIEKGARLGDMLVPEGCRFLDSAGMRAVQGELVS